MFRWRIVIGIGVFVLMRIAKDTGREVDDEVKMPLAVPTSWGKFIGKAELDKATELKEAEAPVGFTTNAVVGEVRVL